MSAPVRCLITGGAGFIGSHLAACLLQAGHSVRVLDNLRSGYLENLSGLEVELVEGSVTDRGSVDRAVDGCGAVFHLAAMVSVPESMRDPLGCAEINVTGLLHVLEAGAAAGVSKLVFASSAAVYGDNPASPKTEDMPPAPLSPYAITKLDGEYYAALFTRTRGLPCVCLRFFNVFGPRQDPGSAYAAAVPIFIRQALDGQPLAIHGDGLQTRDFVHVTDVVEAMRFAAFRAGLHGVFNVGYGRSTTVLELANAILRAAGSRSPIVHEPARAGDVRHSCACVDRLLAAGFRPVSNLDRGLAETLEFFRNQTTQPAPNHEPAPAQSKTPA